MAQCNTIFTALYYFLECYWSPCKPIIGAKPKMLSLLRLSNHKSTWLVNNPWRRDQNTLRGMEQPSRHSKIYSVRLQLAEGEYSAPLCVCPTVPLSVSTSRWVALAVSLLTTVMTLKTYLQWASLHYYSKKSSPVKYAEDICFIFHSI